MEAVAGMLLHSTALRPVSCTVPMRIPGVCVWNVCMCACSVTSVFESLYRIFIVPSPADRFTSSPYARAPDGDVRPEPTRRPSKVIAGLGQRARCGAYV